MDFDLNDEQRLLKESIDRLMADRYGFDKRQGYIHAEGGFDRALWQEYADLGLFALPFREEDGGIGGGPEEVMLVMEAFGRALAVEPYLPGIVMASSLINALADEAQRATLVPGIISGERRLAIAHTEMGAGNRLPHVATVAREREGGWTLEGAKTLVLHGGTADAFLLTARLSGE
ncbi:MAG TPA: acyl-CoA dehydrogenase family protein, partial [Rhabdaerophilum sp.]|nr:acyl-CoA dehydrogenase family protein [Rhabdaerophilum sp.]